DLLHRLREAGPVAPRAVEAEGGHAYHDQARVLAREVLVADAQVVEHAGREVLHHAVRLRDHGLRQPQPPGPREVDRDAARARSGHRLPPLRAAAREPTPPRAGGAAGPVRTAAAPGAGAETAAAVARRGRPELGRTRLARGTARTFAPSRRCRLVPRGCAAA